MTGRHTLRPRGDLDLATVERLRPEWYSVAAGAPNCIVVDLRRVTFIDSTALGLFVGLLQRQHEHGGEVLLRGATDRMQRLLHLTGLDLVFHDAHLDADPEPERR